MSLPTETTISDFLNSTFEFPTELRVLEADAIYPGWLDEETVLVRLVIDDAVPDESLSVSWLRDFRDHLVTELQAKFEGIWPILHIRKKSEHLRQAQ